MRATCSRTGCLTCVFSGSPLSLSRFKIINCDDDIGYFVVDHSESWVVFFRYPRKAKIGSAMQCTKLVASGHMYAPPGGGASNHNNRIADFQLKFCVLIRLSAQWRPFDFVLLPHQSSSWKNCAVRLIWEGSRTGFIFFSMASWILAAIMSVVPNHCRWVVPMNQNGQTIAKGSQI